MKSCGTAFLLMRTVPLQPDEEKMLEDVRDVKRDG